MVGNDLTCLPGRKAVDLGEQIGRRDDEQDCPVSKAEAVMESWKQDAVVHQHLNRTDKVDRSKPPCGMDLAPHRHGFKPSPRWPGKTFGRSREQSLRNEKHKRHGHAHREDGRNVNTPVPGKVLVSVTAKDRSHVASTDEKDYVDPHGETTLMLEKQIANRGTSKAEAVLQWQIRSLP